MHADRAFSRLYPDAEDVIHHAIHLGRRTKVAKAIKLTYADEELEAVQAEVPPEVQPYLSAMLCPLTSLALVGMSHQDQATCLDNDLFRLAILRKLHLLLWDAPPARLCRCGKTIDIYGDHFFTCSKMHKGGAHNVICNALHLILEELGPIAGLCFMRNDVRLEAQNLSQRFP